MREANRDLGAGAPQTFLGVHHPDRCQGICVRVPAGIHPLMSYITASVLGGAQVPL